MRGKPGTGGSGAISGGFGSGGIDHGFVTPGASSSKSLAMALPRARRAGGGKRRPRLLKFAAAGAEHGPDFRVLGRSKRAPRGGFVVTAVA